MNDYLWDRSGADPDVERIERVLRPLAFDGRPLRSPAAPPSPPRGLRLVGLAAAALLAVGILRALDSRPAYRIEFEGGTGRCAEGAWVGNPAVARTIEIDRYGIVTAEPGARVRVLAIRDDLHKLRLEQGTLRAVISADARPGLFQVETPATTCIDLGCKYTLTVDEKGRSHVSVQTGRVAFQDGDREVFIPRGARCEADPGRGPSTPVFDDTPTEVLEAARAFDASPAPRAATAGELARRIGRLKDTLLLWHLLQDREEAVVSLAVARLVDLAHHPDGVDPKAKLTPAAVESWKEYLYGEWLR